MTPELAQQAADLGAFALLVLTWALLAVAFLRGWFVPGWLYLQLRKDWEILRDQGDRNSKALELMANHERDRLRGGG